MASASPSAATSTRPSGRLRTHPCTPSRTPADPTKKRKPTPWTRPLIRYRRARRMETRSSPSSKSKSQACDYTSDYVAEESTFPTLKRLLVGKPIPSHLAHHERLSRVTGLAVLSSDALSSVAYATDFILVTLVAAGPDAIKYVVPISVVIASLLAIVAFSYRQ